MQNVRNISALCTVIATMRFRNKTRSGSTGSKERRAQSQFSV